MKWNAKDFRNALDSAGEVTESLVCQARELLEDWGVIERRRRVWPWLTAIAAASAVGTFFLLRRSQRPVY